VILAGVILAGGASRRMGSPKALLRIDDGTFADRLIGLLGSVCGRVIVVLGHDASLLRAGIAQPAEFVVNPDHALGQLTSLQCGLRAAGAADAVLFTPVDYPAFRHETVRAIADAWTGSDAAVVPVFGGRRGHPVLIGRRMIEEMLALPAGGTARDVMHRYVRQTRYVETDDPGILRDIDIPEEYEALCRQVAS
jgi:molybdenum cofactor cytidylyltransferase